MKYGVATHFTEYSMRVDALAKAAEERGFESIFVPEHTHIPVERRTPFPLGGDLPEEYYHDSDPFISLMAAAMVTTRLRLGTGISLVIEHDPIVLAKVVATLDLLSNGRVILGVGAGWNEEEMSNHGTPPKSRWKVLRERIEAMRLMWEAEKPEYHGDFVNFDPIHFYPKPVQKPLPVLLGGHGYRGLRRVVRYCDGWMPVAAAVRDPKKEIQNLHELAMQNGRDPKSFDVTMMLPRSDPKTLERHREAGVTRVVLALPIGGADAVLPRLDQLAKLIDA
ncbi:MAG TPA: LLM class F420-dependent oxidoreductase [Candidatus Binataceae bacterium]|nr:LLM class F420-dependent oxidoreductase [Candidatus Binataceae bacterium]